MILSTLCLAAHLWFVNVASAAPLFAVWMRGCKRAASTDSDSMLAGSDPTESICAGESRRMALQGITALAIGMLIGLLLGGLMEWQNERALFDVLPRFAHKIRWGIWELAFYFFCMTLYLALQRRSFRGSRWLEAVLALLAATNLLYHFPPLFTVMASAAKDPESISLSVTPSEFRSLMMQGHVAALSVHFGLASFAVVGAELLNRCAIQRRTCEPSSTAHYEWIGRRCITVSLAATASQMLVGVWLLMRFEPSAQRQLMGGDLLSTCLLGTSVAASFWLLHLMAAAAFGELSPRHARCIRFVLIAIICMMSGTLRSLN